jgi:hypothetical protein
MFFAMLLKIVMNMTNEKRKKKAARARPTTHFAGQDPC